MTSSRKEEGAVAGQMSSSAASQPSQQPQQPQAPARGPSMRPLASQGGGASAISRGSRADFEALPETLAADEVRLTLVRHGETDWNQAGRIQGQLDQPLNAVGHRQAEAAASRFAPGMIDVLHSSDLLRASQTAAPIARALGLAVQTSPVWRERHFGAFQGSVYADIARDHPEVFARLKARDPAQDLSGGESLDMLMARVSAGLDEILAWHRGKRVMIVSHGGVLDCIYRRATGMMISAPRNFPIFNASINQLRWVDGRWEVVHWADISHLVESSDELDPAGRPSEGAGRIG